MEACDPEVRGNYSSHLKMATTNMTLQATLEHLAHRIAPRAGVDCNMLARRSVASLSSEGGQETRESGGTGGGVNLAGFGSEARTG